MQDPNAHDLVETAFTKMQLSTATRHVFLCVGPSCCTGEQGLAVWERLKARLKEKQVPALRTKAACLRVCHGGPWLLVYPEGIWYGDVTLERCDRIIDEHLIQGRPVQEWISRQHPLPH
jgi:(2Fe-2S) ferredoxin